MCVHKSLYVTVLYINISDDKLIINSVQSSTISDNVGLSQLFSYSKVFSDTIPRAWRAAVAALTLASFLVQLPARGVYEPNGNITWIIRTGILKSALEIFCSSFAKHTHTISHSLSHIRSHSHTHIHTYTHAHTHSHK